MDLASPAPKVEDVTVEPVQRTSAIDVEPARFEEPAVAEPAKEEPVKESSHGLTGMNYLEKQSKVSVETLRKQGIDFESRVAVCRGAPKKNLLKLLLPICFDERDFVTFSEIARYAVIRAGCCFVYLESTDMSPLYAFTLGGLYAELEDPDRPDKYSVTVNPVNNTNKPKSNFVTVLLKHKKNKKVAHQFTFDIEKDNGVVKRFMDVVERNSKMPDSNAVQASVVDSKENGKAKKSKNEV